MNERHRAAWYDSLFRQGHAALAVTGLLAWSWLGPGPASVLLLPAWAASGQLIFAGSFEAARLRRRAWLGQYLRASSPWQRRLRGGPLMALRHQLLGLLLALLLLQNAVTRTGVDAGLALVGWLVLLLTQSAFAWAFVRLMVGGDALRSRLTRRPESEREDSA